MILAEQLSQLLNTPVSESILSRLTDKQRNYLEYQYNVIKHAEKMEKDTGEKLWDDDKAEALKEIKSVLDYGKSIIKPKECSDKAKFYLKNKLK